MAACLTSLLLLLTPAERAEVAREVAGRLASADDDELEREWLRALERRFGRDSPHRRADPL